MNTQHNSWKGKILALVLSVSMILCMMPNMAFAEDLDGGQARSIDETYVDLNQYLIDNAPSGTGSAIELPAGNYYLSSDLNYTAAVLSLKDEGGVYTIDLNGHTFHIENSYKNAMISVNGQVSSITITDSNPTIPHRYMPSSTNEIDVWKLDEENGTIIVNGGAIVGAVARSSGGVIYTDSRNVEGININIENVNFIGNKATQGSCVYDGCSRSNVNISNAKFYGNLAYNENSDANGGAIVSYGYINLKNVTASENIAYSKNKRASGGFICALGRTVSFGANDENSEILVTNNKAIAGEESNVIGGGVSANGNGTKVFGKVVIKDNYAKGKNTSNEYVLCNLSLPNNPDLYNRTYELIALGTPLAQGSEIYFNFYNNSTRETGNTGVLATSAGKYSYYHDGVDPNTFFKLDMPDDSGTKVYVAKNKYLTAGIPPHEHSWVYEAAETTDSINAYCVESESASLCNYQGSTNAISSTLTASDNTYVRNSRYNGAEFSNEIKNTAGVTTTIKYIGRENTSYAESSSAPINVGKYTAKVTIGNVTATKDFEITKKVPDASDLAFRAPSDLNFNETSKTATVNAIGSGLGNITVKYFKAGEPVAADAVINAGTYTVKVDVTEGTNYSEAVEISDPTWTFEIVPKAISGTVSVEGTAKYDETLIATYVKATDDETVGYEWYRVSNGVEEKITGETEATYRLKAADVDTTIIAKAVGTGNYAGTVSSEETNTIAKANAVAPAKGEGYSIDFINEEINQANGYEIKDNNDETGKAVTSLTEFIGNNDKHVYIRKVATATHEASDWTEIEVPTRQAMPNPEEIVKVEESIKNKKDAKLEGIGSDKEYKIGDSEWIQGNGNAIENPNNDTILVRMKATHSAFASLVCTCEFTQSETLLTVDFGKDAEEIKCEYNATVNQTPITKEGYKFAGWFKDKDFNDAWNVALDTVTDNLTLYAKWIRNSVPTSDVTGTVSGTQNTVRVELKKGNDVLASTTTNAVGKYELPIVEPGDYNIVVTDGEKIRTKLVTISEETQTIDVAVHTGYVSSRVEIADNLPNILVGGLDDFVESMMKEYPYEDLYEFALTAKAVDEKTADEDTMAELNAIKESAKGQNLDVYDIAIECKVEDEPYDNIHYTDNVMELVIPFKTSGKSNIKVYRYHDYVAPTAILDESEEPSPVETFIKIDERRTDDFIDGTYYIGKDYVVIYTNKFSLYAIGYNNVRPSVSPSETVTETPEITPTESEILKAKLLPQIVSKKTSQTITWNEISEADGYMVYGTRCMDGSKLKLIKNVKGASNTSYNVKNLKAGKYYRYRVVAYKIVDGKKVTIEKSLILHEATTGGKFGTITKLYNVPKTKALAEGKTYTFKPKQTTTKTVQTHVYKFRYESSNPEVAKVTKYGKLTALKAGTATIYVFAEDGQYKAVKVTVA